MNGSWSLEPFDPAHARLVALTGQAETALRGLLAGWPGVGELWLWLGERARENPVALARRARHAMLLLRRREGFVRLQAHVREDDETAGRFAGFLGLRREGVCPGYGPDHATHHLYGRFWQWKE